MTKWLSKNESGRADEIEIRGKVIPGIVVQILKNRGWDTKEKIEQYFAPTLSDLHNPFLMTQMERAVDRIIKALHSRERVLIHGDYDTDGITAVALLLTNLKRMGIDATYYIPNRLEEGYGLSSAGVEQAVESGCTLIIAVDCGITAVEEVLYAKKHNIDVIICDHHKAGDEIPEAAAVLDPKIPTEQYPFRELAGIGVAFKLIEALYEKTGLEKEQLYQDLDLVALGTVVDIVPLVDENRVLVKYGINRIKKSKKPGFRALLKESKLNNRISSYHLGFIIGPRINACGRLRDAKEALELFLTDDYDRAVQLAERLSADNRERQAIEEQIYREAFDLVSSSGEDKKRVIVLGKEEWHEGIVGIVASRISEYFHRPTILLSLKEKTAKGSARSIPDFDITEALKYCSRLLLKFGGHSQAAGLEIRKEDFIKFSESINKYAASFDAAVFERKRFYDVELDLSDITDELIHFLKYFEPTGMANPQPVFLGRNFEIVGVPRVVGSDHLKFALRNNGRVFSAIAYGRGDAILEIEPGKTRIDCLYSIHEDSFFGKKKVVLKIKEMKKTGEMGAG